MKAEELRINNLVLYKWFDKNYVNGKQRTVINREVVKILAIDSVNNRVLIKTNQTRKNHTWVNIGLISPLQLTEEILLKCGFASDEYKRYWIKGLCIHLRNNEFYVLYEQGRVFVKYLHQLQNLYFALTGQELEVRL